MEPLAWDDPLPARPRRILVAGTSGSGKTTLSAALSASLGLPHVDIDGLYHGPAWTPRPTFAAEVAAFAATDECVTQWQYSAVRPLLLARAEMLVWLDLSRLQVLRQLVPRTVRRRLHRIKLWNRQGGRNASAVRPVDRRAGGRPTLGGGQRRGEQRDDLDRHEHHVSRGARGSERRAGCVRRSERRVRSVRRTRAARPRRPWNAHR